MIPENKWIMEASDNLFLIALTPPIRGFDDFIGVWLYRGDVNFIVDAGPSATAPQLLDALGKLGVSELDYILLTHIHLDHAGAIGEIADFFAGAKIVCHKGGIPHLVNPEKLWEGTLKTLGATGRAYGPVKSTDHSRFIEAENFSHGLIEPISTPGHAAHHISYLFGPYLFAGEAGGVFLKVEPGLEYLRPATPPRFFMNTFVESLDSLLGKKPETICYGHFGLKEDAAGMLLKHRRQLYLWKDIIQREWESSPRKNLVKDCQNLLLNQDQNLEAFFALGPDMQERERVFLANSILGFTGYLQRLADNP